MRPRARERRCLEEVAMTRLISGEVAQVLAPADREDYSKALGDAHERALEAGKHLAVIWTDSSNWKYDLARIPFLENLLPFSMDYVDVVLDDPILEEGDVVDLEVAEFAISATTVQDEVIDREVLLWELIDRDVDDGITPEEAAVQSLPGWDSSASRRAD